MRYKPNITGGRKPCQCHPNQTFLYGHRQWHLAQCPSSTRRRQRWVRRRSRTHALESLTSCLKSQHQVNPSVEQRQRYFGDLSAAKRHHRCVAIASAHAKRTGLVPAICFGSTNTLESKEKRPMNATVMTTGVRKTVRELKSLRTADYKRSLESHRCCRCCRCGRGGR